MASIAPFTQKLGLRLAAHLLRRASYAYSKATLDSFAELTPSQALDVLFITKEPTIAEPIDPKTGQGWINSGTDPLTIENGLRQFVKGWWLNEARQDGSIAHKMMFFLHGCFTTEGNAAQSPYFFDYLGLLRFYALGNYKSLAYRMTVDNMMLRYLDNTFNEKGKPNENYAREFLELFTIGKGPQIGEGNYTNYTETDVKEGARVLTGFKFGNRTDNIDPVTGIAMGKTNIYKHDTEDKTFSSAFGNQTIKGGKTQAEMHTELQEYISMVFNQKETARFSARRLYRYFVSTNITTEIETDIIEALATTIYDNNYELKPALRQLLESQNFYDADDSDNKDEIIGSLLKSPIELLLQAISFFELQIADPKTNPDDHYSKFWSKGIISAFYAIQGFDPFYPPDVAGYPAYYQQPDYTRLWFNASSIIPRYKMPEALLYGKVASLKLTLGTQLDIVNWIKNNISNPYDAETVVYELISYLHPEQPDTDRYNHFLYTVFLDGLSVEDWNYEWDAYIKTSEDGEVKAALNNLINALMIAPEYQVF